MLYCDSSVRIFADNDHVHDVMHDDENYHYIVTAEGRNSVRILADHDHAYEATEAGN